jgi:hypothetical protein
MSSHMNLSLSAFVSRHGLLFARGRGGVVHVAYEGTSGQTCIDLRRPGRSTCSASLPFVSHVRAMSASSTPAANQDDLSPQRLATATDRSLVDHFGALLRSPLQRIPMRSVEEHRGA